jgi:hypothetical protein
LEEDLMVTFVRVDHEHPKHTYWINPAAVSYVVQTPEMVAVYLLAREKPLSFMPKTPAAQEILRFVEQFGVSLMKQPHAAP